MRAKGNLRTVVVVLLIVALVAGRGLVPHGGGRGGSGSAPSAAEVEAKVIRAVDGDTILARVAGHTEYVRYIGMDTPETVKPGTPVQCYGPQAHDFNARLVEGRTVRLRFGRERTDKYGRLLAYVYAGRTFVNAELVRRGYARTLTIPPNDSLSPLFARLAQQAGQRGIGLWSAC